MRVEASRPEGWYDLIHSHYWLSGQVGWLASERWNVPLVHTMHTMAKVKNRDLSEGDTPEPPMRVIGEEQVVAAAAKAYRVYYKRRDIEGDTYTMDHSSIIYLMDARGKYVTNYSLEQGPDKIAEDLAKRLR